MKWTRWISWTLGLGSLTLAAVGFQALNSSAPNSHGPSALPQFPESGATLSHSVLAKSRHFQEALIVYDASPVAAVEGPSQPNTWVVAPANVMRDFGVRTAEWQAADESAARSHTAGSSSSVIQDAAVTPCGDWQDPGCPHCGSPSGCECGSAGYYQQGNVDGLPSKYMLGVDDTLPPRRGKEHRWQDAELVPWETYAYGEYLGPYRTPHLPVYRLRIGDSLDFVYGLTRTKSGTPYVISVGDVIQITSGGDSALNQPNVLVLHDGTISLPLVGTVDCSGKTLNQLAAELNERYSSDLIKEPAITVQVIKGDTLLNDIRDSVDARAGQGGQSRQVIVTPDGTIQLPFIGPVPAIGLTLDEIAAEVNARYELKVHGITVTPILLAQAPRAIFVSGLVNRPGRVDVTGPTTLMQALTLAGGPVNGGNLRNVIVFRRDENWRLVATKLDISGALFGRNPHPADEIWLRDSDIVLVPPMPIFRFSQQIDLYLRRTVYSIFPQQNLVFNFDTFQNF